MAIEAPLSKYKKKNMLIFMAILIGAAIIFGYDGYLSKYEWSMRHNFYKEHVIDNGGMPDSDMAFNQKAPPIFAIAGIVLAIYYFTVAAQRKVAAEDSAVILNGKEAIAYDAIEKINKTNFESKGYFIITYTDSSGQSKDVKISDRTYDNLPAVLDHIVAKIS